MKTDWRKVRDSLASDGAFGTFDTFGNRDHEERNGGIEGVKGIAKSANSVKRSKEASSPSKNLSANTAKSAKSNGIDALNSWEWIEERAALLEFDGGMNRDEANTAAFICWYRQYVESE